MIINRLIQLLLFVFIILFQNIVLAEKQEIDLYILAGQSNMQGHGQTAQLQKLLCALDEIQFPDSDCYAGLDQNDRVFETITDFYRVPGKEQPQYNYQEALARNSANVIVNLHTHGHFNQSILQENPAVKMINIQYRRNSDGSLSTPTVQSGNLAPGYGAKTNKYGPELFLGTRIAEKNKQSLLVKIVQGGSDLYEQWRSPSMALRLPLSNKQSLYPELLNTVHDIKNNLSKYFSEYADQDVSINIMGLFWFQGWNDSFNDSYAMTYEQNLNDFISDLRHDLNVENLPVYIAQSHNASQNGLRVQEAQKNISENIANAAHIITNDLSAYYHYDSASHTVIGSRLAEISLDANKSDFEGKKCCYFHPCKITADKLYENISIPSYRRKFFVLDVPENSNQLKVFNNNAEGTQTLVRRFFPSLFQQFATCHIDHSAQEHRMCAVIKPKQGKWFITVANQSNHPVKTSLMSSIVRP